MATNVPAKDEVDKIGAIVDCDTLFMKRGRVATILERKKLRCKVKESCKKRTRLRDSYCNCTQIIVCRQS